MSDGAEAPDLRILQANERTFLAWLRTGLALMAFGFVAARIVPALPTDQGAEGNGWLLGLGVAFLVLGVACNLVAAGRYVHARKQIVKGAPIVPGPWAALSLAIAVGLLGALLILFILLD